MASIFFMGSGFSPPRAMEARRALARKPRQ